MAKLSVLMFLAACLAVDLDAVVATKDAQESDGNGFEPTQLLPFVVTRTNATSASETTASPEDAATGQEDATTVHQTEAEEGHTSPATASHPSHSLSTSEAGSTPSQISTPPPDPCQPNPCVNGGACRRRGKKNFQCLCRKGFGGKRCERVDWCQVEGGAGKSYCDRGEARCLSDERNGNYSCLCYNRKEEFDYQTGECRGKDVCQPNPCLNGGTCTTSGNRARCRCPRGIHGRNCARVDWCGIEMENGQSGDDYCDRGEARCVENPAGKNFTCLCYNRRKMFDPDSGECLDKETSEEHAFPEYTV